MAEKDETLLYAGGTPEFDERTGEYREPATRVAGRMQKNGMKPLDEEAKEPKTEQKD